MAANQQAFSRLGPLIHLVNNWISALGVVLTTTGGVAWLFTLPVHFGRADANPYLGLLVFFVLPAIFFSGLLLIPLGIWLKERRERRAGIYPSSFPAPNWASPEFRRFVGLVGIATAANVVIGGHTTYSAVEHMDSVSFCGQTCHIMTPEFVAFQNAPHSRLACVDCHIGRGVESYVAAKLNGAKQLIEVLTNTYPTPVPTPVHNLAQGNLTCEECHADQDIGVKRREWFNFAPDENNSATRTELLITIGGGENLAGAHGAHISGGAWLEYRSDPKRREIPWMRYTAADGRVTEYAAPDWNAADAERWETRRMDCTDCHNRAAHSFENADYALNRSLAEERVDPSLPFVKREGLRLLTAPYESREQAARAIPEDLRAFYRREHPDVARSRSEAIEAAASELLAIYERNVFPEWGVEFGTHPNLIGHEKTEGCYRCHNDDRVSSDPTQGALGDRCEDCHDTRVIDQPISPPSVRLLTRSSGARDAIPRLVTYDTAVGPAPFDHAEHVRLAEGDCVACHNKLFPMAPGVMNYGLDLHRAAEDAGASCAGCHRPGGETFGAAGNCRRCHANLTEPTLATARFETRPRGADPLPGRVEYETDLGTAFFDHKEHVDYAEGRCADCHNKLFPMTKAPLDYGPEIHQAAEAARSSCAGCHVAGGETFAAAENCSKCHVGLGEPRETPATGRDGLPESLFSSTRLGQAKFGHERHVELAEGDCTVCHNKVFPLEKGFLNYKDDLHRTSESTKTSCGACHVEGGEAFPAKDHCLDCHVDLQSQVPGSQLGLPERAVYDNRLGRVVFDHDEHIREAKGDCRACHNEIFPMEKVDLKGYAEDHHRAAESNKTSCAACHAPQAESFGALENCTRCHEGLEIEKQAVLIDKRAGLPLLPFGLLLLLAAPPKSTAQNQGGFVGSKRCAVCHEEESKGFVGNPHQFLEESPRYEAAETACESCHGPGLSHVLGLDPERLTNFRSNHSDVMNRACLDCHAGDVEMQNARFDPHSRFGVECTSCHNVHGDHEQQTAYRDSDALCSSCHADVRVQFNRPFRHKIETAAIGCVDCHNPHGERPDAQLVRFAATEVGCARCHADKAGPFPFEHAPVRLEPCSSCHEPHGSMNPRMLTRHVVGQLCLECHSMLDGSLGGPPTGFHDPRSARFQSCTTCHSKIHGSFVSRDFLR